MCWRCILRRDIGHSPGPYVARPIAAPWRRARARHVLPQLRFTLSTSSRNTAACPGDSVRKERMSASVISLRTREAIEEEVRRRVETERAALQLQYAARQQREHFQRPVERPFTATERDRVTILFGGLTSKHEWLIKSVFS